MNFENLWTSYSMPLFWSSATHSGGSVVAPPSSIFTSKMAWGNRVMSLSISGFSGSRYHLAPPWVS